MTNNQEIVKWLGRIEQMAGELYSGGAMLFRGDPEFSEFLEHLAEDEAWHYHVMSSASEFLSKEEDLVHAINVDLQTREGIENPFTENFRMLTSGALTKESLIECIIATEYSEWNHIFLYVINTIKKRKREFGHIASRMRVHMSEIEHFMKQLPYGDEYVRRIRGLSGMLEKKILVVDDNKPITDIMAAVLENEGTVVTAENGLKGYDLVRSEHYDAIVTDVEMPVLNGIEFYRLAVEFDRSLKERFLFFSSTYDDEQLNFIKENNLQLLKKPADISDIRESVRAIIEKTAVKR